MCAINSCDYTRFHGTELQNIYNAIIKKFNWVPRLYVLEHARAANEVGTYDRGVYVVSFGLRRKKYTNILTYVTQLYEDNDNADTDRN